MMMKRAKEAPKPAVCVCVHRASLGNKLTRATQLGANVCVHIVVLLLCRQRENADFLKSSNFMYLSTLCVFRHVMCEGCSIAENYETAKINREGREGKKSFFEGWFGVGRTAGEIFSMCVAMVGGGGWMDGDPAAAAVCAFA